MDYCNIMLAVGGNKDHTVPKYNLSVAELALLRLIHGDDSIFDVELVEQKEINLYDEKNRLLEKYSEARDAEGDRVAGKLYSGTSKVFEHIQELFLPEEFFKATVRAVPKPSETPRVKKGKTLSIPAVEADVFKHAPAEPVFDREENI